MVNRRRAECIMEIQTSMAMISEADSLMKGQLHVNQFESINQWERTSRGGGGCQRCHIYARHLRPVRPAVSFSGLLRPAWGGGGVQAGGGGRPTSGLSWVRKRGSSLGASGMGIPTRPLFFHTPLLPPSESVPPPLLPFLPGWGCDASSSHLPGCGVDTSRGRAQQ